MKKKTPAKPQLAAAKADLVSPTKIASERGTNNNNIENLIKRHKLVPAHVADFGAGRKMRLFERSVIEPLVDAWIESRKAKIAPASQPPVVADPGTSLSELAKHLAINDATLDGMAQALGALDIKVDQLKEQNVVMHRTLTDMRAIMQVIARELGVKVEA